MFKNNKNIQTVTFATRTLGLTIGRYAFYGCTNLENIEFPAQLTSIEYEAFENCTKITQITIPRAVTFIGNYAFDGWTADIYLEITRAEFEANKSNFGGLTSSFFKGTIICSDEVTR